MELREFLIDLVHDCAPGILTNSDFVINSVVDLTNLAVDLCIEVLHDLLTVFLLLCELELKCKDLLVQDLVEIGLAFLPTLPLDLELHCEVVLEQLELLRLPFVQDFTTCPLGYNGFLKLVDLVFQILDFGFVS
jgi:hypothetical protein